MTQPGPQSRECKFWIFYLYISNLVLTIIVLLLCAIPPQKILADDIWCAIGSTSVCLEMLPPVIFSLVMIVYILGSIVIFVFADRCRKFVQIYYQIAFFVQILATFGTAMICPYIKSSTVEANTRHWTGTVKPGDKLKPKTWEWAFLLSFILVQFHVATMICMCALTYFHGYDPDGEEKFRLYYHEHRNLRSPGGTKLRRSSPTSQKNNLPSLEVRQASVDVERGEPSKKEVGTVQG